MGSAESESGLLEAARAVGALAASRSSDIESLGYLPQDIVEALEQSGLYKMLIPAELGGAECKVDVFVKAIELLAQEDASTAWCTFICCTSSVLSAYISPATAKELFLADTIKVAGVFAPSGRAVRVVENGVRGFRVNGRWAWGSGSRNADLIVGGCCIIGEDDQPELLANGKVRLQSVIFNKDQVTLLDNWTAFGLKGTGSGEFEVSNAFVPEQNSTCLFLEMPIARPLYQFPVFGLLGLGIAAVSLGVARAALQELKRVACTKVMVPGKKTLAQRSMVQQAVAVAEAKVRSCRAFTFDAIREAWRDAEQGSGIALEMRRDLRLATTYAVDTCVEVVQSMYSLGGGLAVFETSRLQKYLRDVNVLAQHVMVNDSTYELTGRMFLDLEVDIDTL